MNKLTLASLILLLTTLIGCQSNQYLDVEEKKADPSTTKLTLINWELVNIHGVIEKTMQAKMQNNELAVHLILHEKDDRISGFSGCNRYFGRFKTENSVGGLNKITFSGMGATKMACFDMPINEQDYFNALASTVFYQLEDNALTLLDESLTVLATFKSN